MRNTELTPVEIADLLRYAINHNKELAAAGKNPIAYELKGEAGTAKSSVAEQVSYETGMPFIKINTAQVSLDD